ncbi:MAG: acetylglutamate kinase [Bacteroidota bacterium]
MKNKLSIVKVGGKIVEEQDSLKKLLKDFSLIEGHKILVHGGGRSATKIGERLGIESKMVDGRRVTDAETLDVVTMVYGGLVNKSIVAGLQALATNALGMTGADLDIIRSEKRPIKDIDYGFVGDVKHVNADILKLLVDQNIVPILAPLTHDGMGNILNTNADTIAAETAQAMAAHYDVTLIYCFEKKGVLMDEKDDDSVIPELNKATYREYVEQGIITGGMLPKLDNAFKSIDCGVQEVVITQASAIATNTGTRII